MPNSKWIKFSLENEMSRSKEDQREIIRFWNEFYIHYENRQIKNMKTPSKSVQYKQRVFEILEENKDLQATIGESKLREIQMEIEDLTMLYDEPSMFKTAPNIIRQLINTDKESAKDFLRGMDLLQEDRDLLSEFGQYTIEGLIVHVLGLVFNTADCASIIRVSSLVERLESSLRVQATLFRSRRYKKTKTMVQNEVIKENKPSEVRKRSKLSEKYPFGTGLVTFLVARKLITLTEDIKGTVHVQKKKGSYFLPSNLYAYCNFDISLLPIKLNLPMICLPLDWTSACPTGQTPRTLDDLSGGYLSSPTGEIYDRYRLLSSGNHNNFYIDIGGDKNHEKLCSVMNKLQCQAFQINSDWLSYIQNNESWLVERGYLLPRFLASINIKDVLSLLREFYLKDKVIKKIYKIHEVYNTLHKNIQCSRYEQLIINLAIAYEGYNFYLPAFLDFRGRIYRCGILHFHERDLARSLIVFADSKSQINAGMFKAEFYAAIAFHYKSFVSVKDAYEWFDTVVMNSDKYLPNAQEMKRPFQFLANLLGLSSKNYDVLARIVPITQDASASAYQIMSYFLLDETLAKRTNLIPSSDGQIKDIYSFILEELKEFMKAELSDSLSSVVCNSLTRKIVKGIFMPIIYGKTLMSTAFDLKDHLYFLFPQEHIEVASVCFKFWRTKYYKMECLIRLIRNIGWFTSARDCPVFYRVPYFTTVQDYMKMDSIKISVYNRLNSKRHQVTFRVSSSKRDRRKTEISTFVNFIHQRDAQIAMSVVDDMLSMNAPIYTVHDNFITTAQYSHMIPKLYSKVIRDMGPPLSILNEFIYMNVIKPIAKGEPDGPTEGYFANKVIPKEMLSYYLKENVPKNISKKTMKTWEERISGILNSYENYTHIVCGHFQSPREGWQAHEKKWEKFKKKITKGPSESYYCVHY